MDVETWVLRNVYLDNEVNLREIYSSGDDISGDHDPLVVFIEFVIAEDSLVLLHVTSELVNIGFSVELSSY